MKPEDILHEIRTRMQNIKRDRREPGAVVVSSKFMRIIQDGYYDNSKEYAYPFFPDFSQFGEERHDKVFGIPISVIQTQKEDYLEVYPK